MPGENVYDWSVTATNNANADSLIDWQEGQARASVNNSARSMLAAHAKALRLMNGSINTGGTGNAQTFVSGVGYTTIPNRFRVLLRISNTNSASATLNMDGIGARIIKDQFGDELAGRELLEGAFAEFVYDSVNTHWVLLHSVSTSDGVVSPGGRLTLTNGVPVMTTSVSGAAGIYYTPYKHSYVPLFNGSVFSMTNIGTQLSVSTSDTANNPSGIGGSEVNDWFIFMDGNGVLRLCHGPDWTNATTRSAGTALQRMQGVWLNNAAITNGPDALRGTYVGTTWSNAAQRIDWIYGANGSPPTAGALHLWNYYNRVRVLSEVGDSSDMWTYQSGTVREAEGNNTYRHSFVSGMAEDAFIVDYRTLAKAATGTEAIIGIGYDATSAFIGSIGRVSALTPTPVSASYGTTAIGHHFVAALERASDTDAAVTFYGHDPQTYSSRLALEFWM